MGYWVVRYFFRPWKKIRKSVGTKFVPLSTVLKTEKKRTREVATSWLGKLNPYWWFEDQKRKSSVLKNSLGIVRLLSLLTSSRSSIKESTQSPSHVAGRCASFEVDCPKIGSVYSRRWLRQGAATCKKYATEKRVSRRSLLAAGEKLIHSSQIRAKKPHRLRKPFATPWWWKSLNLYKCSLSWIIHFKTYCKRTKVSPPQHGCLSARRGTFSKSGLLSGVSV